jgi:ribosomal-protein-alanine N-acetyltransferase
MIGIDPDSGEDFAVEFEGALIGKVGMLSFPTIGFIFHPDMWGRGLASEAVRSVVDRRSMSMACT